MWRNGDYELLFDPSFGAPAEAIVRAQLFDDVEPAVADGEWLLDYVTSGSPFGPPIIASIGETWEGPPPDLLEALAHVPVQTHGYQLSPHGLPRLRALLREYLAQDLRLSQRDVGRLRVAVSWSGTRAVMFDFARLVARSRPPREPVALVPAPSWDYAGVLEAVGYRVAYFELSPASEFRPDAREARRVAAAAGGSLALVVVNAQHNPTGVDWGEPFVETLADTAARAGAALLIDDAHYWLHPPDEPPTSAAAVVCRVLAGWGHPVPWLAVRSLGKQFCCNGWALGALLGEPEIVDALVGHVAAERQYSCGGAYQWALADWLETGAAAEYLDARREGHAEKLTVARTALVGRLGYPPEALHGGQFGPFLLIPIPPAFAALEDGVDQFRKACFARTGVMLSDAWPLARKAERRGSLRYARIHLGIPATELREALDRLHAAGIGYQLAA